MTDAFARIFSGALFLIFSLFGLWWLRREYRQHGKLTWFGSIVHILIFAFHGLFTGALAMGIMATDPTGPLAWLGLPLMGIGLGLMLYAMDWLREFSHWLGTSTSGLNTNGLYRYSRNPQFVAYGLLILGFVISWWNSLAWIGLLAYAALAYAVTHIEEEHLERTYGQAYRDYCNQVSRYLSFPRRS